jgi:hypothetical protein
LIIKAPDIPNDEVIGVLGFQGTFCDEDELKSYALELRQSKDENASKLYSQTRRVELGCPVFNQEYTKAAAVPTYMTY